MRSIRALFTAVERRRLIFKDENDGLDPVAHVLATHLSPMRQQASRDDSGHPRDRLGHHHTDNGESSTDVFGYGGPVCSSGYCYTPLASVTSTAGSGSTIIQSSSTSTSAEVSSTVVTTNASSSSSLSPQSTSASVIASTRSSSIPISNDSATATGPPASSTSSSSSLQPTNPDSSSQPTNDTSTPLLSMLPAPSTSSASSVPDESTASTSPKTAIAEHANKTGAIVGGVIGGIVFLILLILGCILFLRRRRRKRTPASAEFRDYYIQRSGGVPLAAQGSVQNFDETDPPPPPFTQGNFSDPLFEKIRETRQAHIDYGLAI